MDKSEKKNETWQSKLRVMNDRFKNQLDENVFEGVRDEKIYHGLKLTTATILHKSYDYMTFCNDTQEFLVLDRGIEVQRYSMQGKQLRPSLTLDVTMTFRLMMYCEDSLISYELDVEDIWILTSSCTLLQIVKNEFGVRSIYYEPKSNEIIVVGTRQTTKYSLDDKEQELESSKEMTYNDPEFGVTWQLETSSLIPATNSCLSFLKETIEIINDNKDKYTTAPTQLVTSYQTTLYILPLEVNLDKETDEETPDYLSRKINAAKASITAVHFHITSSWILTGDQQGNVIAWSLNWECMMSHDGVHDRRILGLYPHPSICGFLSYSNSSDGNTSKLQVWSCNFRDKIECFTNLGRLQTISVIDSAAMIVTFGAKLSYLTMRQMYCFFAPMTSAARWLHSTQNPMYPTKVIVAGKDNSVRIFSAKGKQLNVQILPEDTLHVMSSIYSGNEDQLFTIILKSGEILVSDASVQPMKFRNVYVNDESRITCLTIYEYFDEIRDCNGQSRKPRVFYPISIRIIAGTENGNLVIINHKTGKHENTFSAHIGSVVQIRSFSVKNRLVSLGIDNCVKVWRIFADLTQPLALYYTIYFIVPITHVSLISNTICIVNSSESSNVHKLIMENITDRYRLEHCSSKDHTALIVNMITSETLEICATSSLDNTIRIWDQENFLINILEINTCAWNVTFSSVKGDIIFSAGRHLYRIPYKNHLSPRYRAKIVAKELFETGNEKNILEDSEYKIYDDTVDRDLMLHPVSSIPLASIDTKNTEFPSVDLLIQKQICALFDSRDEDIKKIKNYLATPTKSVGNRALMTSDEWEKYVNDLLKKMTRSVPETPTYDFHSIVKMKSEEKKTYNESGVFKMRFGYSTDELDDKENLTELIKDSKLPLHTFLPNSILYKWKEESILKIPSKESIYIEPLKYRYPPEFYPEEEESIPEKRESIRLSQLMLVEKVENEEETA